MQNNWTEILAVLQKTVDPGLFQIWIKPLQAQENDKGLVLTAPNAFVAAWVKDKLLPEIVQAAAQVLGKAPDVVVAAAGTPKAASEPLASPLLAQGRAVAAPSTARVGEQIGLPLAAIVAQNRRSWQFSFEDFVVGPSNELAYASARALCRSADEADRLFLCSSPGLGKTHLLQAVGATLCAASNKTNARIEYLSAEEFARLMLLALRAKDMESFKARFRDACDILILEDVHFLQGKEKTQDELLAVVKTLRDKGAKVVFSSSFLPREMKEMNPHLSSRFGSGFVAVIDKPDFDMRVRILKAKAQAMRVSVPDTVVDLLAEKVRSDVRRIEACLKSLIIKTRLLNRDISLEAAMQVVRAFADAEPTLSIDRIVDYVCEAHELSGDQISSKSRERKIVSARNTAFYMARKFTELSLEDIGARFNKRHSTVLKGITNIEREITLNTPAGRQIQSVIERFKSRPRIVC